MKNDTENFNSMVYHKDLVYPEDALVARMSVLNPKIVAIQADL